MSGPADPGQEDRERLRTLVKPHLMRDNSQVPISPEISVDNLIDLEAQPNRASGSRSGSSTAH